MEKFFCPVCKTIRPDRRISFLRNPFCTMDANFPRSARQTDNSFFYFYFFSIPTSRATHSSPGNVVPADPGATKNMRMATKRWQQYRCREDQGRVLCPTAGAASRAGSCRSPAGRRWWRARQPRSPGRCRPHGTEIGRRPRSACPTGTALPYLFFRLAIFFGYCFLYNRRASASRFSLRSMSSSWAERCSSLGSGRRWM